MDSGSLIPLALISLIVWAVILHAIITGASRSKSIEKELKTQSLLLAKLLQKNGVDISVINTILTTQKDPDYKRPLTEEEILKAASRK